MLGVVPGDMHLRGHSLFAATYSLIILGCTMSPMALIALVPAVRKCALKICNVGKLNLPKDTFVGKISDSLYRYAYDTHF